VIRCAVIGGMVETGLWQEVTKRFEGATQHQLKLVAFGPKATVVDAFRHGGIDVITVHASDAMIDLVADGLAVDPEPWARNDLVLVGPADDPAGVRGMIDAFAAVQKIVGAKQKLLVHATMGADGVLHDLTEPTRGAGGIDLSPSAVLFTGDDQHQVLARAAELHAYTLVGRIPVLEGKLQAPGIEVMVKGDPRLRRPYLVEVATTAPPAARELAAFLRSPETQQWLASYGKGKYDDQPLFYPVTVPVRESSP
jgi:tungstate transport system substrate-binding protein